jgi:hypothetical protein
LVARWLASFHINIKNTFYIYLIINWDNTHFLSPIFFERIKDMSLKAMNLPKESEVASNLMIQNTAGRT